MTAPLGERIRAEVEESILSGALGPGSRLPTERELMARHGCSRMTVHKALSALAGAGLIERRKRAGSFVSRPRVHSMVLDIRDLAEEIASRGQQSHYKLLRRAVRTDAGEGRMLTLEGVHLADGHPFAAEYRQVSLAAVPEIENARFDTAAPGSWLLRHVPWDEAESRIAAEPAQGEVAEWLGCAQATATLVVERRTWRGGEGITFVRQHFRGDSYDLVARFGAASR